MCTLEKLQAWPDVGPFGNWSREEETMQSGWGKGGGVSCLILFENGGASEQQRGLTQGCRERSSLAAKNAVGTPAGGSSGHGPPRKRVRDRCSGGHLRSRCH